MPIYEFVCEDCDCVFDRLQKYDDENPACPECTGNTAKIISAPSFVLKGSGWYKDGYSKKPTNSETSD